jgi:hypothetical protein
VRLALVRLGLFQGGELVFGEDHRIQLRGDSLRRKRSAKAAEA